MVNGRCESNAAKVSGIIMNEPVFGHEIYGEGFYYFDIQIKRLSDSYDIIPITVSERLTDFSEYKIGRYIEVEGQFRSYNSFENEKNKTTWSPLLQIIKREICSNKKEAKKEIERNISDLAAGKFHFYHLTPLEQLYTYGVDRI